MENEAVQENSSIALMRIIEKVSLMENFDASKLSLLLDTQLRFEANEARKLFEEAFARFKNHAPQILKTKKVSISTKMGGTMEYSHAELDVITKSIGKALQAEGIQMAWDSDSVQGSPIVTCVLTGYGHTHRGAKLSGSPDTSGGKGTVQAIGSTFTYLKRYTLLATCGLEAEGMDDDGKTEGIPEEDMQQYLVNMEGCNDIDELKRVFEVGWEKAKACKDINAKERLMKYKDTRKKQILGEAK